MGSKKMSYLEFLKDESFGTSWADDDIDVSSLQIPTPRSNVTGSRFGFGEGQHGHESFQHQHQNNSNHHERHMPGYHNSNFGFQSHGNNYRQSSRFNNDTFFDSYHHNNHNNHDGSNFGFRRYSMDRDSGPKLPVDVPQPYMVKLSKLSSDFTNENLLKLFNNYLDIIGVLPPFFVENQLQYGLHYSAGNGVRLAKFKLYWEIIDSNFATDFSKITQVAFIEVTNLVDLNLVLMWNDQNVYNKDVKNYTEYLSGNEATYKKTPDSEKQAMASDKIVFELADFKDFKKYKESEGYQRSMSQNAFLIKRKPKPNPFGNAKPVDFLSRELEVDKLLNGRAINSTTFKLGVPGDSINGKHKDSKNKPVSGGVSPGLLYSSVVRNSGNASPSLGDSNEQNKSVIFKPKILKREHTHTEHKKASLFKNAKSTNDDEVEKMNDSKLEISTQGEKEDVTSATVESKDEITNAVDKGSNPAEKLREDKNYVPSEIPKVNPWNKTVTSKAENDIDVNKKDATELRQSENGQTSTFPVKGKSKERRERRDRKEKRERRERSDKGFSAKSKDSKDVNDAADFRKKSLAVDSNGTKIRSTQRNKKDNKARHESSKDSFDLSEKFSATRDSRKSYENKKLKDTAIGDELTASKPNDNKEKDTLNGNKKFDNAREPKFKKESKNLVIPTSVDDQGNIIEKSKEKPARDSEKGSRRGKRGRRDKPNRPSKGMNDNAENSYERGASNERTKEKHEKSEKSERVDKLDANWRVKRDNTDGKDNKGGSIYIKPKTSLEDSGADKLSKRSNRRGGKKRSQKGKGEKPSSGKEKTESSEKSSDDKVTKAEKVNEKTE